MKKIGRLVTAMVTPFNEEGAVDYEQAKKLALALLNSGSEGVVVVGTTGESPTLVRAEELRLFREVKSAIGSKGTVIAGTGSNSTAEALEATKEAERTGVDACLLVVPYYNKPTQEGLYQHFKAIAASTSLPCILYNVPSRTVTSLSVETVIKLSNIDNIVGIKEASGNLEQIARIVSGTRKDFLVWSGNDGDTLPILAVGGYGVISVASHLVGKQISEMISSFAGGKVDEAASIHRHLLPLFNAMFVVSNPIPVKYALNHIGFRVGKPRMPLTEPDEKSAALIRDTLKDYKIDLPRKFSITLTRESRVKEHRILVPADVRSFFPSQGEKFTLDVVGVPGVNEIQTNVRRTEEGHTWMQANLEKLFDAYKLKVGDELIFAVLGTRKYSLEIRKV